MALNGATFHLCSREGEQGIEGATGPRRATAFNRSKCGRLRSGRSAELCSHEWGDNQAPVTSLEVAGGAA